MSVTLTRLLRSTYHDSMYLLKVSGAVRAMPAVEQAFIVMGTPVNKDIMADLGFEAPEFADAELNDLMLAVRAADQSSLDAAVAEAFRMFKDKGAGSGDAEAHYRTIPDAAKALDANLAVISVPGVYAAREARKALDSGLNVLVFSDAVTLEDERSIKELARDKGLLCMGPDCGVANLNGVSLVVGSIVGTGPIGMVGASGSGLQLATVIADVEGVGVSQAIGTGGRDLSDTVGGITTLMAIDALEADPATTVIVVVSRVPGATTLPVILDRFQRATKPIVACLIGSERAQVEASGAVFAEDLAMAGYRAVDLALGRPMRSWESMLDSARWEAVAREEAARLGPGQRYLRGLYCGGTFTDETLRILPPLAGDVYSNATKRPELLIEGTAESGRRHTVVDFGSEEFTAGRPHPVIDPEPRTQAFARQAADPETAAILMDFILGPAVHPDPVGAVLPEIVAARERAAREGRYLPVVASVCGTEKDPQRRSVQQQKLRDAGVVVTETNAQAARVAGMIVGARGGLGAPGGATVPTRAAGHSAATTEVTAK
jgi:FdrA protein